MKTLVSNLQKHLQDTLDINDVKLLSTYRNIVFTARLDNALIYIKFSGQPEHDPLIQRERFVTQHIYANADGEAFTPRVCPAIPESIMGHPCFATYAIPGRLVRDICPDLPVLLSWVRAKRRLHELTQALRRSMQSLHSHRWNTMYDHSLAKWRRGLRQSEQYSTLAADAERVLLETLHIVSASDESYFIQGDPSLENAISSDDGRVHLIDFERSCIGDRLWDIFGAVRDYDVLSMHREEILTEYGIAISKAVQRRVAAVFLLAAIDWLSHLHRAYQLVKTGIIPGVPFARIVQVGEEQYMHEIRGALG